MRENEFEKRVRDKMDGLGFDPSEAVWAGVNKEINQEDKRRKTFFWLFFCSGLLLAGSGYYFYRTGNNSKLQANKNIQRGIKKSSEEDSSRNHQIEIGGRAAAGETKQKNKKDLAEIMRSGEVRIKQSLIAKTTRATSSNYRDTPGEKAVPEKNDKNISDEKSDDISIDHYNKAPANTISGNEMKQVVDSNKEISKSSLKQEQTIKPDSLIGSKTATEKNQKNKLSKWKIGYTAGTGVSNIKQNLFTPLTTSVNYAANPPGAAAGSVGSNTSPHINPGFAFTAGVFVTKSLSERFSFTAGLNYQFYSTRVTTGSKISSNPPASLLANQVLDARSYYQNGNDHPYTNQFHFLEIPVSAGLQLNKSKKSPVVWELGFSLAYLVGSNALYYDPYSNVYFASNQEANKMQLNAVTAILFGFHLNKNEWQIGPQFQYGMTDLFKEQTNNPGHLLYGGIKVTLIPGKK